jgi:hypothetical protein
MFSWIKDIRIKDRYLLRNFLKNGHFMEVFYVYSPKIMTLRKDNFETTWKTLIVNPDESTTVHLL